MATRNNIYFASDLHLGVPSPAASLQREKHFVAWLEMIKVDAAELILLGDVFDFWFEYNKAVPKGYVRLFGKLAELADLGVKIYYFAGNHDMWMQQYFTEQFGAELHFGPIEKKWHGRHFFFGHGDGLGPGDHGYKFLKKVFRNKFAQWSFHRLHPNFGIGLADYWSRKSRKKTGHKDAIDHGDKEFLWIFANETIAEKPEIDYFIFGHRHLPMVREIQPGKAYINLGDWISHFTYLKISAEEVQLMRYPLGGTPEPFQVATAD